MSRRLLLKRRGARDNPWLVGKVSLEADRHGGQPVGVFRVTELGVGGVGRQMLALAPARTVGRTWSDENWSLLPP